ncbi:zinc finger protein 831 [Toxotes jaculatrix]|uniref:zinc finger protein 831 n=1 Tax=Toxotes jaculatrix TaxID=941984 RepID=UPI001B3A858A|nr:zinc finger protein 831 [Toxotes jaculatrix]
METSKPGLASAPVHISSVAAQTEKRMDIQAPLTAVYIHTVPALPAQPYPQLPAADREPATLHLAMPPLYSKETLPFLTYFHIAGGLQSPPGMGLAAAAPTARPKSAGKHVCPHCGRDCMKPSVLEKHLRCHTGERPYPCTTCGVSFKTQSNLYKHKRTQAHARLSSESEQSSLGSLDSVSSSRETHASSSSLDERSEDLGSMEKDATLPAAEITCPDNTAKICSVKTQGSVSEQNELTPIGHETKPKECAKVRKEEEKLRVENEKPPLTVSRHLPLQRQEATLFSKQWESSVSRGKSQNHESTDSGFSESTDHYSSPGSVLRDHSMDSLAESSKEDLEETTNTHTPSEPGQGAQEPKDIAREQEQKTLEERISKLISENTAVVEDKQLENVRPRKTVLSKQGSIDLPMPYTYKDSFHFDMRISKTPNVGLQRNIKPGLYSSVPTQHSTTMEHAPLTRSNSLPFSVTLLQPEKSSPTFSYQSDYVTLVRRGSSGQINPTGFAIKPVNQQSSTHRPLVRQTAVDCNHATDGLSMNSSVEEACTGSLSCDGDGGDICGEPSNRKFRRKKAQKFAYNKWYMYGGGTFKKLYNAEKAVDNSVIKSRKSMNPEHEVVQGPQKRLSAAHNETITTTTGSVINTTNSGATLCHPGCPPARVCPVSAVDFNLSTSRLHSSCSSLKTPLRRNLSLSVLPLPSIGSLVNHKTNSMSSTEAGRLINEEKHNDSTSQLCGAHVPSDRKKQRTDDKIICPLQMETDPNTLIHPPPSVTGSAPQQDTNLSYISLQTNQKHTQLKGALFSPCIINANAPSVGTLQATSIPSAAKTSFLPKYQLKLPNAAEPDSNTSPHVVDKPSETDGCTFTPALSSTQTEQTSPAVTTSEKKCSGPVTSPLMQRSEIKNTNIFNSTQAQLLLPCTATTFCQAEASRFNEKATTSLPVVHRQFAATTITTTCLHDYQARLCSALTPPSNSAAGSVSMQLPRLVAPVVANFPAATAKNPTSAAAITAFSQDQLHSKPPLSHSQVSPASDQLNPVNTAYAGPNNPNVPCHIVPFDQGQPAAQNVFHVHTADLQICLQIISDEQLALIEPQIERQAGTSVPQRRDMETMAPEVIQNKTQSSVTVESNEGKDHHQPAHQKELDQRESLSILNTESIKPPLSDHFAKAQPNIYTTEHSNSSQATVSAESKPPETLGLMLHPHKYSHVNTATETLSSAGDVMSTAASLEGVQSGRSQTTGEEHALSLNHCTEEQPLQDRRVSQGGLVSQTFSGQHMLSVNCLSPSAVNQKSTRSEPQGKESQQKLKNQAASCNAAILKTKCETSAYKSSKLESGETHTSLQVMFSKASGGACGADELSGSVSPFAISKCKAPRQSVPQSSIYCCNPSEPRLSETLNASKHAIKSCDKVGPLDNSANLSKSQDVIGSVHSERQLDQFTSVSSNIQVERPKDIPAVLTSIQSPTAGLIEAASLARCAAPKEPQTWGHGSTPGNSDNTVCRPKQSQEARESNHRGMDEQGGGGVMRKDKNEGIKTDQVPGQRGKGETNCRHTVLPPVTKLEGEDRQVKEDSFKNSWLSEQHLSQMLSGMSEYPPQSPQQAPSMSNNLNLPAASSQTCLFNSPQPTLEMNNFYFSQQHWESSSIHNQQTQILCESNSSQHMKTQAQITETQNAFSQIQSSPQKTTISHQDQKQGQKQTQCAQQGNATEGNNSTAVSCCTKLTLGSHRSPSPSPDVKTSSTTNHCQVSHSLQVSRPAAGWTGNTQTSNSNMLDNNTGLLSKPFTYPEPAQETKDRTPDDYTTQSSNSGRPDVTNKYQSFFFTGHLHGYHTAESLTSGVRPVQSCQDYSEDTSSSDDEGKLIIEL